LSNIIYRIFGKKKTEQTTVSITRAPSLEPVKRARAHQGVQYDRALIPKLTADHTLLIELFAGAIQAAESGHWEQAHTKLQKFRSELNGHLLLEGVKLYAYMSSQLDGDVETAQIFKSYKVEMGEIGKVVFTFFDQYRDLSTLATREQQTLFLTTAVGIAQALTDRISREEAHLYPLYQDCDL
jgi:hypothetical protein